MRDAVRKPWEAAVPVARTAGESVRASESLADVPHRPRLSSYPPVGPKDRLRDLYGSLSTLLGIMVRGQEESEPQRRRRARNRALFAVLFGVVVLFYFLTMVRMGGG